MVERVECRFASVCADQGNWKYLCHNHNEATKYCSTYHQIAGFKKIK